MTYIKKQKQKKRDKRNTIMLKTFVITCAVFFIVSVVIACVSIFQALEREIEANTGYFTPITREIEWQTAPMSIYNVGDPNQTDASPCIGASGDNLCDLVARGVSVCAFNQVPLRTVIQIKGKSNCIVLDRTSEKYGDRIDWALPFTQEMKDYAFEWGVREVKYRIIN